LTPQVTSNVVQATVGLAWLMFLIFNSCLQRIYIVSAKVFTTTTQICRCICMAQDDYHDIWSEKGETILLWCNTTTATTTTDATTSTVNWTHTTVRGKLIDVYISGQFMYNRYDRYSMQRDSLHIYNAQIRDSGHWDCYQHGALRTVGYHLNVTGTNAILNFELLHLIFLDLLLSLVKLRII